MNYLTLDKVKKQYKISKFMDFIKFYKVNNNIKFGFFTLDKVKK